MDARSAPLFNPFLPEFREDPHPMLHRLRAADPVHWSASIGVWVLTRYADVLAALHEPRLSSDIRHWTHHRVFFYRDGRGQRLEEVWSKWMLQMDPPDHTRLRVLVAKALSPRIVEQMRPGIERMVYALIDEIAERGEIDFLADFAYPLPIRVICALLGVPEADHERIKAWSLALLPAFSPAMSAETMAKVNDAAAKMRDYFAGLVAERRAKPGPDLLSAMITAREQGDRLSEQELLSTCTLLGFAGHATTAQLLGNALLLFMRHPGELDKLRAQPELAAGAVEETLRHASPLQMLYRVSTERFELGGKTIEPKQMAFVSLAAANRDPEQFPDPDRFDIARKDNKHVAFGHGIHYCVGAPLARLEGQIALAALAKRFRAFELVAGSIKREPSPVLRAMERMRVRVV